MRISAGGNPRLYHACEDWDVTNSLCERKTQYTALSLKKWKANDILFSEYLPFCEDCDKILKERGLI